MGPPKQIRILHNFVSVLNKSPNKNFLDIPYVQKDAQTGDRPVCASNQEEGEMKKNCYGYIILGLYYGNNLTSVYFL